METAPDARQIASVLADFLTTIYGEAAGDEARRRALRRQDSNYRDVAEIWLAVCEAIADQRRAKRLESESSPAGRSALTTP